MHMAAWYRQDREQLQLWGRDGTAKHRRLRLELHIRLHHRVRTAPHVCIDHPSPIARCCALLVLPGMLFVTDPSDRPLHNADQHPRTHYARARRRSSYFVKTSSRESAMFDAEAAGLRSADFFHPPAACRPPALRLLRRSLSQPARCPRRRSAPTSKPHPGPCTPPEPSGSPKLSTAGRCSPGLARS